jgi:hypothetical protein
VNRKIKAKMKETFTTVRIDPPNYRFADESRRTYPTPAILPIIPASVKTYPKPANSGYISRAVLKREPLVRVPIAGDDACWAVLFLRSEVVTSAHFLSKVLQGLRAGGHPFGNCGA